MSLADLAQQIDEVGIDRALVSKGFKNFVPLAWHLACPSAPFVPGWHLDAIADHLDACLSRDIKRLVINVPPGSTKSLTACVMFPAYAWTQQAKGLGYGAKERFIYGTYDDNLARRDSLSCRNLIGSQWFQDRWGEEVSFDESQEFTGGIYYNQAGGSRKIVTVGGSVVGFHASIQITDDPVKPLDVTGSIQVAKTALDNANNWWNGTMSTRAMDYNRLVRIIIMQRLHHADLAGEMLGTGDYEHLMLPMEYEPKRKCFIETTGFEDPRTEAGELLCPARFNDEAVGIVKNDLGPRAAQAQLQQNPTPIEGAIFRLDHAVFYMERPKGMKKMVQSWDLNFKKTDDGSFVVGQVWGKKGESYYLLDQYRKRVGFNETCEAIKAMSKKWPMAMTKLIEDKANGPAVFDALKKKLPGMVMVNPEGGKESRANAVETLWETGHILLPDYELAPWIKDTVEEICSFPAYSTDDCVDAMSQALVYMHRRSIAMLKAAMANVQFGGQ